MKSRINILHLISSSDFLGAERVVCELAANANNNLFNIQVGVIGSPENVLGAFRTALNDHDCNIYYFPCTGKLSWAAIRNISNHLNSHIISIIHSHGYKSDIYAYLANKFSKTPVALLATNHTWKLRTFSERIYKVIDILVLNHFDVITAVSAEVRNEMVSLGIDARRISIMQNGISLIAPNPAERAFHRKQMEIKDHEIVLGCVASLTPEKAHSDLIRAFSIAAGQTANVRLVLIGDGVERTNLLSLCQTLGINDQIVFAGTRSDARRLYAIFDVFALVSYAEGLPMALLEAMSAHLPVVVTSVGGMPNVVTDGKQGFVIKPGDSSAIAAALTTLFCDPELRRQMGQAAYATVAEHYSSKRMAQEYEALYLKLLETT